MRTLQDSSFCIDHSLILLPDFYRTNFVTLRNHSLAEIVFTFHTKAFGPSSAFGYMSR